MKIYKGIRSPHGVTVTVEEDGQARPLPPRNDLFDHSPDGFAWGYGGSGPAQLALAILADHLGDDAAAVRLHQNFKWRAIATIEGLSWRMTDAEVAGHLAAIGVPPARHRSVPPDVLAALIRLNAHARAYGGGKWAIYAYKEMASILLAQSGEAAVRGVEWRGECNRCGGTGQYWSYDPNWKTPCRNCSATGKVRLRFVEMTLPGGSVWHHPWLKGGLNVWRAAHPGATSDAEPKAWEDPGEWQPNLRGQRLEGDELAGLLNLVESWVLSTHPVRRGEPFWWVRDTAIREMLRYRLELGQLGQGCWICGALDVKPVRLGSLAWPFHWRAAICEACDGAHAEDGGRWPGLPPHHLLTDNIRAWAARRPAHPEPHYG